MIEDRLVKTTEACHITGMSRATLFVLLKENKFPAPIKMGCRGNFFSMKELQKWIEEKVELRKIA